MEIIFLGKSPCIPDETGGDSPCFIIDRKYLVDFGYKSALTLKDIGIDPNDVKHAFLTHSHHDHVMGLPLFIFYKLQTKGTSFDIYGHSPEVADTVRRAENMCMLDSSYLGMLRPAVHELCGGESFDIDDLHVECINSDHAVPGLCYKFTKGGRTLGILGDSRYNDKIADFFCGCDAVVHEFSMGVGTPGHERYANGHSCAYDAAKTAVRSGTGKLFPVHGPIKAKDAVFAAIRESYDGEIIFPELLKAYEI